MTKNNKRRFGDRKDGRLLRSLPAYTKFTPYVMPTRNDATNLYEESLEVSAVDRRLRRLRVEGYKGIGFLHFMSHPKHAPHEVFDIILVFIPHRTRHLHLQKTVLVPSTILPAL